MRPIEGRVYVYVGGGSPYWAGKQFRVLSVFRGMMAISDNEGYHYHNIVIDSSRWGTFEERWKPAMDLPEIPD